MFPISCHNIGHGLNKVVRKVLEEYDAGLISYEYEATACMYDRCGRCLRKGLPMFRLGTLYNDREVLELVKKEVVDYHLCQSCIDKLGIQEFVDSPWDVEERARYDYYHG